MKEILLTGGAGFLGQHLTQALLQAFPEVQIRIIDLSASPYPVYDFSSEPRVNTQLGIDICDLHEIRPAFRDIEIVIHLASIISHSLIDKDSQSRVHVTGTRNVLQASSENEVKLVVHVSSIAALGYNDDPSHPADESFKFDWQIAKSKKQWYSLTKHQADQEVMAYRNKGKAAVIVYPSFMFGPGDYRNSAAVVKAVLKGKGRLATPGGINVVDVRDAVRGIIAVLQKEKWEGDYLLTGWNMSIREILRTIAVEVEAPSPKITLPKFLRPFLYYLLLILEMIVGRRLSLTASAMESNFRFRYFDGSKSRRDLGWSPIFTFPETVADMIKWMRENDLVK